jgi:DNA segregation ATPase FtsK/SpoIIIE-like protein
LILIGLAVVLFAALVSYDRLDLAFNTTEPNRSVHNLVGRVGAWFGYYLQLYVGVGAWIIPVLMAGFGIASFVKSLVYLRNWRSLVASVGLLVACIGVLAMCEKWIPGIGSRRDTGPGPGGTLGHLINDQGIEFAFGRVGAGFVYVVIYLLSLLFLTDYQLLSWVRSVFHREPKTPDEKLAAEQSALEKKAKALERKSRELAKQESKPEAVPEPVTKAAKGPKTKLEPETAQDPAAVADCSACASRGAAKRRPASLRSAATAAASTPRSAKARGSSGVSPSGASLSSATA